MGVSTRGTGNLTNENTVENDFNLITIDSVYMPSGQSCYSEAINESVEWMLNESTGLYIEKRKQKMDKARNEFNAKLDKYGSKIVVEAFKEFISKL
jgi:fructose-1,6-bisphosphatase